MLSLQNATQLDNPAPRPDQNRPLIAVRGVTKAYPTAAGEFLALKGIDLDIYAGEWIGIFGKSGAGKTTLVNMITGVDRLSAGEVLVNGISIHKKSENWRALWRGKNMGIVYQAFNLMPNLSIINNVMLPMDFCGLFQPRISRARAMQLLEQVELEAHAFKSPAEISGGQQQRVAIARALANDPPILVADEPTGRLDSATANTILNIFEDLVRKGKTIVMVTHDHTILKRVSRAIWIADGELAPLPDDLLVHSEGEKADDSA
jgi:putative ABC transport system ATP-binding protein